MPVVPARRRHFAFAARAASGGPFRHTIIVCQFDSGSAVGNGVGVERQALIILLQSRRAARPHLFQFLVVLLPKLLRPKRYGVFLAFALESGRRQNDRGDFSKEQNDHITVPPFTRRAAPALLRLSRSHQQDQNAHDHHEFSPYRTSRAGKYFQENFSWQRA